jgi:7-carboxy-7-deazaguanine synthase
VRPARHGQLMRINEIFNSIQGEGFYTGIPATFIRLQGCTVGCPFCDTKKSWDTEKGFDFILPKKVLQHIVITGGEPLEQDISEIINAVQGKFISVETSGTQPIQDGINWLTVSPKEFNLPLNINTIKSANELKFVFIDEFSGKRILELIDISKCNNVFIQPNGKSKRSTEKAIEFCIKHGFRLSIQMHKYIGIE